MGLKKPKTTEFNKLNRDKLAIKLFNTNSDKIQHLINDGYTINDLWKTGIATRRILQHYVEMYKLTNDIKRNNKRKLSRIARINGRKSTVTLAGVELKEITPEIVEWYLTSIKNGMFKGEVTKMLREKFGYGRKKYDQLVKKYGSPDRNHQRGKLNPMYGKPSPNQSGNGIKSHILYNGNLIFCRSFLEMKLYLFFIKTNVKFELSNHRIKYKDQNGTDRTYNPDIVFMNENVVCEIKPHGLRNTPLNKLKFTAAETYCKKYNLTFSVIDETTYDLSTILYSDIEDKIKNKIIIINDKNLERLERNKNEYN